jgi:hypothetical protein
MSGMTVVHVSLLCQVAACVVLALPHMFWFRKLLYYFIAGNRTLRALKHLYVVLILYFLVLLYLQYEQWQYTLDPVHAIQCKLDAILIAFSLLLHMYITSLPLIFYT